MTGGKISATTSEHAVVRKVLLPTTGCNVPFAGGRGYFGEDVPDKYSLKFVPDEENRFELLCKWCF